MMTPEMLVEDMNIAMDYGTCPHCMKSLVKRETNLLVKMDCPGCGWWASVEYHPRSGKLEVKMADMAWVKP
jgi:ribosomal protein L37AE/L43A